MSETIKFTPEELELVLSIRQEYQNKMMQFGQLQMEKIVINQRSEQLYQDELKLNTEFKELQEKEKRVTDEMTAKYGPGKLNQQTGEFTPDGQVSQ